MGAKITLAADEMETVLYQSAVDRRAGLWHVYSDDPVMVKKLDKKLKRDETRDKGESDRAWFLALNNQVSIKLPSPPRPYQKSRFEAENLPQSQGSG
jgi:hypothetical protein